MAQPGETITRTFAVETAAGVAVTGLTTGSFSFAAYRNGVSLAITPTVAELGSGRYSLSYAMPANVGILDVYFAPTSSSNFLRWPDLTEELEAHDLSSLYGAVAKPTIVLNATGAPTNEVELKFIKEDYHEVSFTVRNPDGTAVDLVAEAYANWRFGVKNADQSAVVGVVPYLLDSDVAITGDADGNVTIVVPEDASFFGLLDTGEDTTTGVRWSLEADQDGDADKTRTLGRGNLVVMRKETL